MIGAPKPRLEQLRVVTLNLWGLTEPLARRMEIVRHGLAVLSPDVLALQEVCAVPGAVENQAGVLAEALGMALVYAPATALASGEEGLAILSRLPVLDTRHVELPFAATDERRIAIGAALAVPGGEVHAFVTHLSYRLRDGVKREAQAAAVDRFAGEMVVERGVPRVGVLMGDFNATPEHDEIRFLRGLHTIEGTRGQWQDAWAVAHPGEPGFTWARRNPGTERLAWLGRDRRLDYVFVSPLGRDGRGEVIDCRITLDRPSDDGLFGSDHFAVVADLRLAPPG
jgi:endonuclease/exonuclease/phosphatase family metal-dependent hydrolase